MAAGVADLLFRFDLELASGVVDVGDGCELRDQFGVVGDADLAVGEALSETVEHLGSEVEEIFGVLGFVSAVDADDFDVADLVGSVEFPDAVDDSGAETDLVDVDDAGAVSAGGFEGFAGGVHEVGLTVVGEFDYRVASPDDRDGLVVAESGNVETHFCFMLVDVFEELVDGVFDVLEWYEGVVGFVGELSEDSDLVGCGGFAFEFEDAFHPLPRGAPADVAGVAGFEVVLDVWRVGRRDVDRLPELAVFVEGVVEGTGERRRVSDHEDLGVARGHQSEDRLEDEFPDAGCFVDDDEDVFVVEALEAFGGVCGESVCDTLVR